MKQEKQKQVTMGIITAPHGVRGQFKVKIFCEQPADLVAYGPLQLEDGTQLSLQIKGQHKGLVICAAAGITERQKAESLKGAELCLAREKLPELAVDEIYHADLLGMQVVSSAGHLQGEVIGLHNFGAGEILEIQLSNSQKTELLPFYAPFLKHIDIAAGQIILDAASTPDGSLLPDAQA